METFIKINTWQNKQQHLNLHAIHLHEMTIKDAIQEKVAPNLNKKLKLTN